MLPSDANLLISQRALKQFLRDFSDEGLTVGIQLFKGFRLLAQRMNDAMSARLSPHSLSAMQFNYLATLYANRSTGLSAGELRASVGTSTGAVTTMIDALQRERLVVRNKHPTDGRSVVIKLTTRGERLYLESAKTHYAYVAAVLGNLGEDKAQKLLTLLVELGNSLHTVASYESSPLAPPQKSRPPRRSAR